MDKITEILKKSHEKQCVPFYCILLLSFVVLICSLVVAFSKPNVKDENDTKLKNIKNSNGVILLMTVVIMVCALYKLFTKPVVGPN
jgi:hypothetical protein